MSSLRCRWFGHTWVWERVSERVARESNWFVWRCKRCGYHSDAFKALPGEVVRMPE